MKLKIYFLSMFLMVSQVSAFQFYKGNLEMDLHIMAKEGHGGKAVVCRNDENEITSVEIQDFFEARVIWGLNFEEAAISSDTFQTAVKYIEKMEKIIGYEMGPVVPPPPGTPFNMVSEFRNLYEKIRMIEGGRLKPIPDDLGVTLPKECKLEQAAIYVDRNLTLIDNEIYSAMDTFNQVGLLLHEFTYYELRKSGETDSRRTRKFVGRLFSDKQLESVFTDVEDSKMHCGSYLNVNPVFPVGLEGKKGISFYINVLENGDRKISMTDTFGLVLSHKYTIIPREIWEFENLAGHSNVYYEKVDENYNTKYYQFEFQLLSSFDGGDTLVFHIGKGKDGIIWDAGYIDLDRDISILPRDSHLSFCTYGGPKPVEPVDPREP